MEIWVKIVFVVSQVLEFTTDEMNWKLAYLLIIGNSLFYPWARRRISQLDFCNLTTSTSTLCVCVQTSKIYLKTGIGEGRILKIVPFIYSRPTVCTDKEEEAGKAS